MRFQKLNKWIVLITAIGTAGIFVWFSFYNTVAPIPVSEQEEAAEAAGSVAVTIDFGDGNKQDFTSPPFVTGATAFSILKDVQVPMVYDPSTGAGVFIRQIGDKKNGDGGKYWQYWVNEKFALVAADKYALQSGDRVEWKFAAEQKM